MLSLVDCIAFSGLTPDQVDAVACYKRIPPIIAAEWAGAVLETPDGRDRVEVMLAREVAVARARHMACEQAWKIALTEFQQTHVH